MRDLAGMSLAALPSGHLAGDLMRCVQYAKTPTGATRCVTMRSGPGPADAEAREEALIHRRYRYDTSKAQTRGRATRSTGTDHYTQVYHGQDARRVSVGRNVPVPGPAARGRQQAVAGLGYTSGDEPEWAGHYRRTREGDWLVYVDGRVVARVRNPESDAARRFPGKRAIRHGRVNVDVLEGLGDHDPRDVIRQIVRAIVETVEEAGPGGAPAGAIFLALQTHMPNLTADAFNQFIGALVAAGKLRRRHNLLFAAKGGGLAGGGRKEHIHQWVPGLPPDYDCACGAVGRRVGGKIVMIRTRETAWYRRRGHHGRILPAPSMVEQEDDAGFTRGDDGRFIDMEPHEEGGGSGRWRGR